MKINQGVSQFSPHKRAAITKEAEVGLIPIHIT